MTEIFDSRIGPVVVEATAKGICRIVLGPTKRELTAVWREEATGHTAAPVLDRLRAQLESYFAGEPVQFDVPLDLSAGTAFQQKVWRACRRIPYGETRSYAELARMAGRPGAARAAGGAMHANPVPVVVPCHRVVKSDGSLGGYGGGIPLKRKLLRLEGAARRRA